MFLFRQRGLRQLNGICFNRVPWLIVLGRGGKFDILTELLLVVAVASIVIGIVLYNYFGIS